MEMDTRDGSKDTEAKVLAAIPTGPSERCPVAITTPVGKAAKGSSQARPLVAD